MLEKKVCLGVKHRGNWYVFSPGVQLAGKGSYSWLLAPHHHGTVRERRRFSIGLQGLLMGLEGLEKGLHPLLKRPFAPSQASFKPLEQTLLKLNLRILESRILEEGFPLQGGIN